MITFGLLGIFGSLYSFYQMCKANKERRFKDASLYYGCFIFFLVVNILCYLGVSK